MLIQITSLIRQPVYCVETNSAIARVSDVIVNPENGQIIAFLVDGFLFSPIKVLSTRDIIGIRKNLIIVQKEDYLVDPKEIIEVSKIMQKNIKVLGNWVKTNKGEWIGRVEDLLVEIESFNILKYYIRGTAFSFQGGPIFGTYKPNRIIFSKDIISITSQAIIVKDDTEVKKEALQQAQNKEKVKATVPEPA